MNWNLAEQLPEEAACRHTFSTVIAGYINAIYLKMKEKHEGIVVPVLSQPSLGLGAHEDVVEYAKEIISGDLSQKLFE